MVDIKGRYFRTPGNNIYDGGDKRWWQIHPNMPANHTLVKKKKVPRFAPHIILSFHFKHFCHFHPPKKTQTSREEELTVLITLFSQEGVKDPADALTQFAISSQCDWGEIQLEVVINVPVQLFIT